MKFEGIEIALGGIWYEDTAENRCAGEGKGRKKIFFLPFPSSPHISQPRSQGFSVRTLVLTLKPWERGCTLAALM
jgi:hypothetical protein